MTASTGSSKEPTASPPTPPPDAEAAKEAFRQLTQSLERYAETVPPSRKMTYDLLIEEISDIRRRFAGEVEGESGA